jgi:hypothetical protein
VGFPGSTKDGCGSVGDGYIGRTTEDGLSVGLEVVAFAQASLISSLASMACASPLSSGQVGDSLNGSVPVMTLWSSVESHCEHEENAVSHPPI